MQYYNIMSLLFANPVENPEDFTEAKGDSKINVENPELGDFKEEYYNVVLDEQKLTDAYENVYHFSNNDGLDMAIVRLERGGHLDVQLVRRRGTEYIAYRRAIASGRDVPQPITGNILTVTEIDFRTTEIIVTTTDGVIRFYPSPQQ